MRNLEDHAHAHPVVGVGKLRACLIGNGLLMVTAFALSLISGGSLVAVAEVGHDATDVGAFWSQLRAKRKHQELCEDDVSHAKGEAAEMTAAKISAFLLILASGVVITLATARFLGKLPEIESTPLFALGLIALVVNGGLAWLVSGHGDVALRFAYLHQASDFIGSLTALVAAGVIHFWHWEYIDPILSVLVSIYFMIKAWRMIKQIRV